jgi:NADPH:quinone reductase-like Zn-dependent oxidoreductase
MKALRLVEERKLVLSEMPAPPAPGAGEVQLRMRAIGLNHIDLWGYRGMAFVKRALPITVGAEGAGEVVSVGPGVSTLKAGDRVGLYGGRTCGQCRYCGAGRDNLCENVQGIMGFHIDGMAAELVNMPARLLVPFPDGVSWIHAACASITFSTVEHMLFDNAKLEKGESILVHAAGSGIGSTAILMAKALGCTVFATASTQPKLDKARAIGADHVINYTEERFETVVRRKTGKRGVDVVFEHVGPATWAGSLLSLARGGRLVTCGSTSGVSAETNLYSLFQQQLTIKGSFGASLRNLRDGLAKMAAGLKPIIDSEYGLDAFEAGLVRLASRDVFGKIVLHLT